MNQTKQKLHQKKEQRLALEAQLNIIIKEEAELADSLKFFEERIGITSVQKPKTENLKTPEKTETKPSVIPQSKEKEVINIEEEASPLQQSQGRKKWYVIFNGPFKGIYSDWSIASHHIQGKNVTHKSYPTKEAAKQALDEAYKTVATEEVQTSKAFTSLNQIHQEKLAKLNSINLIKQLPTTREKEISKKPSSEKFQQCWDSLINYSEAHTTLCFYPRKRKTGPKALIAPGADPTLVQKYFVHGFIDTLYINGKTLKEIQELPIKIQNIIRTYNDIFAHQRTMFFKCHSSYPIFNKEHQLVVPSITIAQLGISNGNYPSKDEIPQEVPSIEDFAISLSAVLFGSLKIGTGRGQRSNIRINYRSEELVIYSTFNGTITDQHQKELSEFEEPFEKFTGILSALPEDIKIRLCKHFSRVSRHACEYCNDSQEMEEATQELESSHSDS